jgi:hypothetical protein
MKVDGERAYSEQNTGIWWENAEKSIPNGFRLLSIILYSDATNVDTLGKSQLHPIYVSIGNIKNWRRNKSDAKQLLGYLPILQAKDTSDKNSVNFKKAVRQVFHESLKILLDPLLKDTNISLTLNNEKIQFCPRISVVIADWPEAATYCLTYKSAMSNFPCHFCLVSRNDLANINLQSNEIKPRTHVDMRLYFNENLGSTVCIEDVYNTFWDLP